MKKITLLLISGTLLLTGCKDLFEPEIRNNRTLEDTYTDPVLAHGIIINAYDRIVTNGWQWSDMATDNAVARPTSNAFFMMADGGWAANRYSPLDRWANSQIAIQFVNKTLMINDNVEYTRIEVTNEMFQDRFRGEAYGLRALHLYHLLLHHAGYDASGRLLGVPIITEVLDKDADFNLPRNTFEECMQQIYSDVEKAIELLPLDYVNITDDSQIPQKYVALGTNISEYNRAFGQGARQLISGRIARAIRAQAALLAASPAYSQGNSTTYEDAAHYLSEILDLNNGVAGIDPNGLTWYLGATVDNLAQGVNPPEILWRGNRGGTSTNLEAAHFPPSLFGRGELNPTQNLVDAFPMANGYPITDAVNSGYNPNTPYANRDPRLAHFILYNGANAGTTNSAINTSLSPIYGDFRDNDGLNRIETSTRTGYYLRKLLRQDVNLNPNSVNGQVHLKPRMRYTDFYLGFAEAANEAWGPNGTGGHAYSAYDIVKAIRQRAGIGTGGNDPYLEQARASKETFRELIRNERRLELCFEDYRFWDIRRWNLDLTETARGVQITDGQYQDINVQNRAFSEYMRFGPIPNSEILKFPALQQNKGWEL